jgi:hypothetical protein
VVFVRFDNVRSCSCVVCGVCFLNVLIVMLMNSVCLMEIVCCGGHVMQLYPCTDSVVIQGMYECVEWL